MDDANVYRNEKKEKKIPRNRGVNLFVRIALSLHENFEVITLFDTLHLHDFPFVYTHILSHTFLPQCHKNKRQNG